MGGMQAGGVVWASNVPDGAKSPLVEPEKPDSSILVSPSHTPGNLPTPRCAPVNQGKLVKSAVFAMCPTPDHSPITLHKLKSYLAVMEPNNACERLEVIPLRS